MIINFYIFRNQLIQVHFLISKTYINTKISSLFVTVSLKMTKFKSGLTPQLSSITKKVAWFNIFIQLAFPISATIPANVFARENNQEKQTINLLKKEHLSGSSK